jgi:hypothetical protein
MAYLSHLIAGHLMRQKFNVIPAHNAGWPSQFRFAVSVFWSGVCEFHR